MIASYTYIKKSGWKIIFFILRFKKRFKMKTFITLLLLFFLNACTTVKIVQGGKGEFTRPENKTTVPFEEIRGMIFVRVKLNNTPKERMFLVDTGSSVSIISEEIFKELSLTALEKLPVIGVQKKDELYLTRLKSLQLGGVVFEDLGVIVSQDMKKISELIETPIDGILGHNALRFFRLQFDFKQKNLTFYKDPLKNVIRIPMQVRWDKAPLIHAKIFGKKVSAIIDTGSTCVIFPKKWVMDEYSLSAVKGSTSYGAFGFTQEEYITQVKNLQIADTLIPSIRAVALGKMDKAIQEFLILGTDVLKGFDVTLDYLTGYAIFKPIKDFVFEKSFTKSGVFLVKKEGKIEVAAVIQNSPADFLGILPEDQLIFINGKPTESFSLEELQEFFLGKNLKPFKAVFQRQKQNYEVEFFKIP